GRDRAYGIAVDASFHAYVVGDTTSADFPVVVGPDLTYNGGTSDGWIAKIRPNPSSAVVTDNLDYCGYIGGAGADAAYGVALDSSGHSHLTGFTDNPTGFPAINGADPSHGG